MEHINGIKGTIAAVLGCLTALWGWFGWLVVAWVVCMLLDYATGTAAALRVEWSSKVARDGLWHKLGAVVAVLVAAILDGVIGLILANVPALTLPFDYTVFLTVLVLVWYIMTELGVSWRTSALGAPVPAWLRKAIAALESTVDGAGDKLGGSQDDESKLPSDWKYECPGACGPRGAVFAGMIKIIGKEFSVCTAQAELVVNPRLGLRGELAPYMLPTITDQEEIGFPIVCHGVLPSALVTSGAGGVVTCGGTIRGPACPTGR